MGEIDIVMMLLEGGANVEATNIVSLAAKPLLVNVAICLGCSSTFASRLWSPVPPKYLQDGSTALCLTDSISVVLALLAHGANTEAKNNVSKPIHSVVAPCPL